MTEPGSESADPARRTAPPHPWWLSFRRWLLSALVISLISAGVEKATEFFSPEGRKHLVKINNAFRRGVEHADPFQVARAFYHGFGQGPPPPGPAGLLIPQPQSTPQPWESGWTFIFNRLEYAVKYTWKTVLAGGAISLITGAVALLGGLLLTFNPKEINPVISVLLAPLIGGALIWGLLQLMRLASLLFGQVLHAIDVIAYISATLPFLAWATSSAFGLVFKEREHHLTGRLIHWLTERFFRP